MYTMLMKFKIMISCTMLSMPKTRPIVNFAKSMAATALYSVSSTKTTVIYKHRANIPVASQITN